MSIHEIKEKEFIYKEPKEPRPEDYYDINETEEQRTKRISMCNEVVESE